MIYSISKHISCPYFDLNILAYWCQKCSCQQRFETVSIEFFECIRGPNVFARLAIQLRNANIFIQKSIICSIVNRRTPNEHVNWQMMFQLPPVLPNSHFTKWKKKIFNLNQIKRLIESANAFKWSGLNAQENPFAGFLRVECSIYFWWFFFQFKHFWHIKN